MEVPSKIILEQAERCGIAFWANRREVRSERMKNALLSSIPELQWAGVNTYGCTAMISVEERQEPENKPREYRVSRMVALRDGVITSCTATAGNLLCKPGQAVSAGEILISGYTDTGLTIRAERAQGVVYAMTSRHLEVVTPSNLVHMEETGSVSKKISLIIGKNRINFVKDSGNIGVGCGKIYKEYSVTLPGRFELPVKVAVETYVQRNAEILPVQEDEAARLLYSFAQAYLRQQMIAGRIFGKQESSSLESDVFRLVGEYTCHEMIGQEKSEEIIDSYEQTD